MRLRSGDVAARPGVAETINQARAAGHKVAHAHLRHLNPFPKNLGAILKNYKRVLIPELNTGQLRTSLLATNTACASDARCCSRVVSKNSWHSDVRWP